MIRQSQHPTWLLVVMALVAVLTYVGVKEVNLTVPQANREEKLLAAQCMQRATVHLQRVIPMQVPQAFVGNRDPNRTGLIGPLLTPITTDTGILRAKLTTTNPNFAAVVVDLLKKAGVRPRDLVSASMTGSMPGLNVATWCAMQALDLEGLVISSVGASNHGATWPEMTWLDMEKSLYEAGLFTRHSVAATRGGSQDRGAGLSKKGVDLMDRAIRRAGLRRLRFTNTAGGIRARMSLYETLAAGRPIRAYINVGGGITSLGSSANRDLIKSGLNLTLPVSSAQPKGVAFRMAEKKIPVIHLLEAVNLAHLYDLPVAPAKLPPPGQGGVFIKEMPKRPVIMLALGFLLVFITLCGRVDLMRRIFRPQRRRLSDEPLPQAKPPAAPHEEPEMLA